MFNQNSNAFQQAASPSFQQDPNEQLRQMQAHSAFRDQYAQQQSFGQQPVFYQQNQMF
ncbi:MAG: hypothetical protein ACK521_01015 [bacterium]